MTPEEFRNAALGLPEAEESAHVGHPDFRVRGKIFATLGYPDAAWAMVKLTPEQQEEFVREDPEVFRPVPGGWGRKGSTHVHLVACAPELARPALRAAWRNLAPRRLLQELSTTESTETIERRHPNGHEAAASG
jgi:hypothetical protein